MKHSVIMITVSLILILTSKSLMGMDGSAYIASHKNRLIYISKDNNVCLLDYCRYSSKNKPEIINELNEHKIVKLYISEKAAYALLGNGKVWSIGRRGPLLGYEEEKKEYYLDLTVKEIPSLNNIIDVSTSNEFTVFVKSDGSIYFCGKNICSFRGHFKEEYQGVYIPGNIKTDIFVISVAAGEKHCLMLTKDGQVYSCGHRENGRLGHGNCKVCWSPMLIEEIAKIKITGLAAGESHSLLLSSGTVFSFGCGKDGQLGFGNEVDQFVPKKVKSLLKDEKIRMIHAARNVSLALTESNKVFYFGSKQFTPKKMNLSFIPLAFVAGNNLAVVDSAGTFHSLAEEEYESSPEEFSGIKLFSWSISDHERAPKNIREKVFVFMMLRHLGKLAGKPPKNVMYIIFRNII